MLIEGTHAPCSTINHEGISLDAWAFTAYVPSGDWNGYVCTGDRWAVRNYEVYDITTHMGPIMWNATVI